MTHQLAPVTSLIAGTFSAAVGAGLGVRVLTSPPTLVDGIVQAVSIVAVVLGMLLLSFGFALQEREGSPEPRGVVLRRRLTLAVIALVVGGAVVVGWAG